MTLQACLGLLDLLGVALLGAIGALTIKGVQSQPPGDRVQSALNFLNIENLSFQNQVVVLGIAAIFILIFKTLVSIKVTRLILGFLAKRSSDISSKIVSKLLSQPIKGLEATNSHELQYAIGSGVSAIVLGILGTSLTVVADLSLLIILGLAIFLINPLVALVSSILLGGIGFLLYITMHKRALRLGEELSSNAIRSHTTLYQALLAYREIFVRNKRCE
jgi:ATP-binding cassette subfamily C protein